MLQTGALPSELSGDTEREGFEPPAEKMYPLFLSREAPSASRPSLQKCSVKLQYKSMQHSSLTVNSILSQIISWAKNRSNISAVALVGSWARDTAQPDSDIDLMFLTSNPEDFRINETWINEIDWAIIGYQVNRWQDRNYGLVWSRHIYLNDETEIEFSFGDLLWASTEPIDIGTLQVISDGCRILYDPEHLVTKLIAEV